MVCEAAAAVPKIRYDNKTANITCQTATTFSVPSSPLQHEILVILLGDPQFKSIFQQNLFGFEPHGSNVAKLSVKPTWHFTVISNVPRQQTHGHLFASESLPSHVDKKCCQKCKALWDCSFWGEWGAVGGWYCNSANILQNCVVKVSRHLQRLCWSFLFFASQTGY